MTLGAARVPVFVGPGPVEPIATFQILVGIEVIPTAAGCVPSQVERLEAARFGLQQVLLQGLDTGRVFDLELFGFAVRPIGLDVVPPAAVREP